MKVTFIAKEPGIYKIIWSNEHSWFKAKTLKYRISVLRPALPEEYESPRKQQQKTEANEVALNITTKLTTSKRKALQKLIDIPAPVIQTYTNIDVPKRREM